MSKKLIFVLSLAFMAGTAFSHIRANELPEKMPFGDCGKYHVKRAIWNTNEVIKGKRHHLNLEGRCTGGQKHGQFKLYFDDILIAKAKIVREKTAYAKCLDGKNNVIAEADNLNGCIDAYVDLILK